MKGKIFIVGGFFVCSVLLLGFQLVTPFPVSPPSGSQDTLEFSMYKPYTFNEVEQPKVSKVMKAQLDTTDSGTAVAASTFWDIVKENWGALLMAFLALVEIIIRATPSVSDNSLFNLLKKIIDALIPNKSANGGQHI